MRRTEEKNKQMNLGVELATKTSLPTCGGLRVG